MLKRPAKRQQSPWLIHFFQRARVEDSAQTVPAREYLERCPASVRAKLLAVVKAVADAPPPMFSGGGKWEAMHDEMAGFYEIRADGPQRRHYRLFCVLERDGAQLGLDGPSLVLITGMDKGFRTTFTKADYEAVRKLGEEYRSRNPRSVVE